MPKAPTAVKSQISSPNQATELLASNPVTSHPVREGIVVAPRTTVESQHPGYLEFVGSGSIPAQGPQWEDSNHFSLWSNLDREGDPWSEEEVEDVFTESHPEVNNGGASQTGMMFSGVELVDGLQNGGSELLLLPWEQRGAKSSVSGSGEQESGPLECVLLSRWDPKAVKDKVLTKGRNSLNGCPQ